MASSLLIAKVLGAAASLGGVAAAVSMGVVWSQPKPTAFVPIYTPHAKVVVVKAKTLPNTTSSIKTASGEAKNYKCRLTSAPSGQTSNCKLVKLDTSAKWVDITKIKNTPAQSSLSVADLKVPTNYFKLEVEDSLYKTLDLSTSLISMDITNTPDSHSLIARLAPLFKLDGETPDYTVATHLLGKASAAATSIASENESKCSIETTPVGTKTECIAIAFGDTAVATDKNSTKYSTQTFTHATTVLEALVQNKYYLLKYTAPDGDLSKGSLTGKTSAYIAASTDTNWASKGTLTDLAPVIVDGTDANAVAFILSTHTPTSAS